MTVAPLDETCPFNLSEARQAVRLGMWVSSLRCLVIYVAAPLVGGLGGLLGAVGLGLQILATAVTVRAAAALCRQGQRGAAMYVALATITCVSTIVSLGLVLAGGR